MVWERKRVSAMMLSMVPFANHVLNRQGVSVDFWDVLAPVIGASKFNFRYLGDAPNQGTPTGTKTKHVSKRGHGKSPRVEVSSANRGTEVFGEENPRLRKGRSPPSPAEAFVHQQPEMRMNRVPLVQRSKEWFEKKHPFIRVDRGNDPFPEE